jgi:Caspase domain
MLPGMLMGPELSPAEAARRGCLVAKSPEMGGIHLFPIFLVPVWLLITVAVAGADVPWAERPTYTLGERWIRSDGVYDLIRVENGLYVFAAGVDRQIHVTQDLMVAKVQKGRWVIEFDPAPKLTWPLEVGKRGTSSGRWGLPEDPSGTRPVKFTWNVQTYEDVQVVAGTFKAFRISLVIDELRSGGGAMFPQSRQLVTWYAPEARQFVKTEGFNLGMLTFQVVALEQPSPASLQVALQEPTNQAHFTSQGIVVAGKVTGGKGVTWVSITLNGAEVSRQEERQAPRSELTLSFPITLREGKNVLLVTAADPEGNTAQAARIIFYDKPMPSPSSPRPVPGSHRGRPRTPAPPIITLLLPLQMAAATPLPSLQMTISSPRDEARVDQESVTLAGMVASGKGVGRVVVTLNGVEVTRLEEQTPQRALAVNHSLKLRDRENILVITATEADGMVHQEVRTVHYEKRLPLTVDFRYPEDRLLVTDEVSVVAAVVSSSRGVAKVNVTLNGAEVFQQSESTLQKSMVVAVSVKLREGFNAIVLSASEPDGTLRQELRTVIYERPKSAEAVPVVPPPVVRERWAVVIGAGQYDSTEIPRLRYAVPDAEAIAEILIGSAGFKKEHVLLLTDKTAKPPTLRNIKWALGTFLARSADKEDTVLIFFAGHGAPEVDPRGIEGDGLAKYLVPIDADPEDLFSTALPMDDIYTIFARIESGRVVFLDTCYSGAAGGRTFASKKRRGAAVDDLFLERLTRSKGRVIITASQPTEVSLELPELGHGIFTYYLVQGLKGAADLNRDGIVSLQELYEYIELQVSRKSRAVGGNQHPVMKGELEGVLPLVKVSRP